MSIKHVAWVLDYSEAEGAPRMVLLVLAEHADEHGRAFPSAETVARRARLAVRTVRYSLRRLKEEGHVVEEGVSYLKTKVYRIAGVHDLPPASHGQGGANDSSSRPSDAPKPPQPSVEPSLEPPEPISGLDDRKKLVDEWCRIFEQSPTQPYSPSRLKAAEKALKEESDLDRLTQILEGAKVFRERKPGSVEFTDIFGTFPGSGDLASRMAWFASYASAVTPTGVTASIPSASREMVHDRQRKVEDMLLHPGDEALKARAGDSQQYLATTWGLHAAVEAVGPMGSPRVVWSLGRV